MSAYVVDPIAVEKIVKAIEIAVRQEGKYPALYPDLRYSDCKQLREMVENPLELGKTMYAMNINAVSQRYTDGELPGTYDDNNNLVPYRKTLRFDACPKPVEVYKALTCYLYQCSEGDVDTLPLYRELEALKSEIAMHIVESLPEYEKAKWG